MNHHCYWGAIYCIYAKASLKLWKIKSIEMYARDGSQCYQESVTINNTKAMVSHKFSINKMDAWNGHRTE